MARAWRPLVGVVAAAGMAAFAVGGVASADDEHVRLSSDLFGSNELPAADPDGQGRARFEFNLETGEVCFSVRFNDVGTPNRGHIHVGGPEENGGIVLPMFELREDPSDPRHDEIEQGRLEGCVSADVELLAEIAANPGGYYVNLHNARFPGGAIRGQLED